jgi:hypothetical protein
VLLEPDPIVVVPPLPEMTMEPDVTVNVPLIFGIFIYGF